jgi:equilibrative nucleoside transporter 1/2/3
MIYGDKLSYKIRLSGGFFGMGILMIILPITTNYLDPKPGFVVDIIILLLFGFFSGIVQSCTYGIAGMLPGKYMGILVMGNSISGIIINILRGICLAALPPTTLENDFYGSLLYFMIAGAVLFLSSAAYLLFEKNEFSKYYIKKANFEKMKT